MKPIHRLAAAFGLALLSACGGASSGGGSSTTPVAEFNYSGGGPNVVQVTVGPGPASQKYQTFNIPQVTVTVCEPGTTICASIPDVLVDTGSSGLRLMASVLQNAGVSLTAMSDPLHPANTIQECLPFADGYAWGAVASATVKIGGETSSNAIPIQVINNSASPSPAPPATCTSNGVSLDSVDAFDANGVLGVSVFNQDCGSACAMDAGTDIYFSCPAAGNCSPTTQQLAEQVANPTSSFPTDNNGVILQLAAISANGATTGTGYLVFGIGTENNNGLGNTTVLTVNAQGDFTTSFNSQTLSSSFIDSGSNALYFNDSALPSCGNSGAQSSFYCPTTAASLTATNQGSNGASTIESFQVADLNNITTSAFAIDDVAGQASPIAGSGSYFDWGLPFFYGRTVFDAIEAKSAAGTVGPYYAY